MRLRRRCLERERERERELLLDLLVLLSERVYDRDRRLLLRGDLDLDRLRDWSCLFARFFSLM